MSDHLRRNAELLGGFGLIQVYARKLEIFTPV
jgi:hypothetical protein